MNHCKKDACWCWCSRGPTGHDVEPSSFLSLYTDSSMRFWRSSTNGCTLNAPVHTRDLLINMYLILGRTREIRMSIATVFNMPT